MSSIPEPQLSSLYQELILEHYKRPRNRGELEGGTVEVHMRNPSCGDEIRLQLRVEGDAIMDLRFVGEGCAISQASVSMMTTVVKGGRLDDAMGLAKRFTEMMRGDPEAARDRSLKDLRAFQGVSKFPVRVKCALLGFDALQEAVKRARGTEGSPAVPGATP
ncbi:MAG: SUF system NifU family Fe-S cluster assembly protein [Gemmatimonadetes bacterium]|nr:SUF system NifU family Fe-S cluster assembly protein [Gemmatimonadota bacterium]